MIGHQRRESPGVTLADRPDFPCTLAAIQFERDHDGFTAQALDPVFVEHRAVRVGHSRSGRREAPEAARRVVEGDHCAYLLDIGRNRTERHRERRGLSGRTGHKVDTGACGLVEEDEVGVGSDFAVGLDQQCRQVCRCRQFQGNDDVVCAEGAVLAFGERAGQIEVLTVSAGGRLSIGAGSAVMTPPPTLRSDGYCC